MVASYLVIKLVLLMSIVIDSKSVQSISVAFAMTLVGWEVRVDMVLGSTFSSVYWLYFSFNSLYLSLMSIVCFLLIVVLILEEKRTTRIEGLTYCVLILLGDFLLDTKWRFILYSLTFMLQIRH
jgi:hypothetical protein